MELKTLNDWVLSKAYKAVPGRRRHVGLRRPDDAVSGADRSDPARRRRARRLRRRHRTGNNNGNAGGGFYSEGGQFYYVRGLGRLETPEDIGNVVLAVRNGTPILVKDVGAVEIGFAPRTRHLRVQQRTTTRSKASILMRTGEQAQTVLKGVETKTDELNTSMLPKDVKVKPFYDRSDLIELTTRTVEDNLLRGIVLVIAVLIFFLFDIRSGLIVAVTIPLALLFAFICLDLRHIPANLLSIGAIDFGILVDGAVVMVENIHRNAGPTTRHRVFDSRGDRRGGGRGGPADRVRGGDHRRRVPADLRALRAVGPAVQADGRHHDLRADRLADPGAHGAAGALRADAARRRQGAAQHAFEWIRDRYASALDWCLARPRLTVGVVRR